jgi:hypothetical protein
VVPTKNEFNEIGGDERTTIGRALLQQLGRRSVDIHMTETAFLMALDVDDTHSY